ncbi:amidohydrolase family protein [Spirosoma sp. BT702]|uniref:Amidohydrolase family protein n=1 Tax=Spirosoma profusum TaxID=2771354 RepID=A0A926Y280_9BACT|nr:amidohydrolase family protein [Spirosoma profusum]MBD2700581.1 amidohydrolase family protein [Spirosoma profusum]
MNRRKFLALAAGASVTAPLLSWKEEFAIPIIDTHIHLFDTSRSQGVPWPTPKDTILYKPALPDRYHKIVMPLGVVGAIVVEASPWIEDNQWVLDVAEKDKIIVGTVGNLEPGKPDFRRQLERFQRNPLFRGIRYGNLWEGHDLSRQLTNPDFIPDLKFLAQLGLVLDTANPNPALLAAVVRITDQVPALRVVIDHLPQMAIPEVADVRKNYEADLQELGKRPQIYLKISEVLRRVDGKIPQNLSFYRERLDALYATFGEDRLLYGSDWPNSDQWLPFDSGLNLVKQYFNAKSRAVAEKYFWKNSIAAYHWQKRDASQPG